MVKIIGGRHGLAETNETLLSERSSRNASLLEKGTSQIAMTKQLLNEKFETFSSFDLMASEMKRAQESIHIIKSEDQQVVYDSRLDEIYFDNSKEFAWYCLECRKRQELFEHELYLKVLNKQNMMIEFLTELVKDTFFVSHAASLWLVQMYFKNYERPLRNGDFLEIENNQLTITRIKS